MDIPFLDCTKHPLVSICNDRLGFFENVSVASKCCTYHVASVDFRTTIDIFHGSGAPSSQLQYYLGATFVGLPLGSSSPHYAAPFLRGTGSHVLRIVDLWFLS